MGLAYDQFKALVRKNWNIQKRSKKELALMLLTPAVFVMIFAIVRETALGPKTRQEAIKTSAFIPSLGCFLEQDRVLSYTPSGSKDVRAIIDDFLRPQVEGRIHNCYTKSRGFYNVSIDKINLKPYENIAELEETVLNKEPIWAAITFHNPTDPTKDYADGQMSSGAYYSIRLDGAFVPQTTVDLQEFIIGPNTSGRKYLTSGFMSLQQAVDKAIFLYQKNGPKNTESRDATLALTSMTQEYPFPKYVSNEFYAAISTSIAFYICLGFLLFVVKLLSRLVTEKEKKIQEAMKIMGLKDSVFWMSWFASAFAVMFVTMLLLSFVAKVGLVFERSDFGVIFVFFQLWGLSTITFCFLVSVFFQKAKVASSVGGILLFVSLLPNMSITVESSAGAQAVGCLLAPTCLALGLELISDYEEAQIGMIQSTTQEGEFSFSSIMLMLIIDTILYALLAWYLDQVLPRDYGIRRKWYFLFTPSYWGLSSRNSILPVRHASVQEDGVCEDVSPQVQEQLSVDIVKLRKEFVVGSGKTKQTKVAVHNLNLQIYENQILALLGHNGAGKTTTVSMLTGFFPQTSGNALVYGRGIDKDMEIIRRNIGLCPQYNVLWDELTVREHLEVFAALKGVSPAERERHITERIEEVGLAEKTNALSSALSGGQKRKLCVSIAFTGGTKVIFLDEPTSGMDPFSRRAIWELLQKLKYGRTIVLTTHFMDEADLLGDRIAIMSGGRVAACGSPLFLKNKFGHGYTLTMVKQPKCRENNVTGFLKGYVRDASLLSHVGAELSYALPLSASTTFGELFTEFEIQKNDLAIESYGISVTTLEEVFLRLANSVKEEEAPAQASSTHTPTPTHPIKVKEMTNSAAIEDAREKIYDSSIKYERSMVQQFFALLTKRFLVSKRDSKALFQMMFYPTIFVLLAVRASKTVISERNDNPITLKMTDNNPNMTFVFSTSDNPAHGQGFFNSMSTSANMKPSPLFSYVPNLCLNCMLLTCQYPRTLTDIDDPYTESELNQIHSDCLNKYNVNATTCKTPLKVEQCKVSYSAFTLKNLKNTDNSTHLAASYIAHYNTEAYHSLPIVVNAIHNSIFRNLNPKMPLITTSSYPLPNPDLQNTDYRQSFLLALNIAIAICIIPGALITSVMREREVKALHQQLVCGVDSRLLWLTYFLSDFLLYMGAIVMFFIVFALLGADAFLGSNFPATIVLFAMYGFAVIPFTYCVSFYIKSMASAQTRITASYISISLAALIVIRVLIYVNSTRYLVKPLDHTFSVFPSFAVAIGIFYISTNHIESYIPGGTPQDAMSWDVAGRSIVYLIIEGIISIVFVIMLERGLVDEFLNRWKKLKPEMMKSDVEVALDESEDIDVRTERARIESQDPPADSVVVKKLRKVYYGVNEVKVAVKNISFGIPEGECFGLLGPNGAGKTTTLSMLSGDFRPTSGNVWLRGHSVLEDKMDVYKVISLCPQFDPLLDLMTGREHLRLFGKLKGIPDDKLEQVVKNMLVLLGLNEHADKLSFSYSGGNKRKLSLGIALLGDPKVIFLDEPSTGMDPGARRFMWNVIANFLPGRSIILTTHSMEECEALCSRIGIVVKGSLKCVGSPQHLKSRFGGGYRLELQCAHDAVGKVKEFVEREYPAASLLEWHGGKLRFEIPRESLDLGNIFKTIESQRQSLGIIDYALSQTTLEQVFMNFARIQEEEQH